ncbi:MAG: Mrp/NBP35 family ATP-binding protein [Thermodesulfobacteriota bacterium]|nr:Mrp/NBP35 family ATP-binding protein [Thermodesulfobacteriota bacterium]
MAEENGKSCSCDNARDAALAVQDEMIRDSLGKIKNILLVMSGKGGVGKSTVATNLAVGLSQSGYKVGLMDVDLHGPNIPRMLGVTGQPENLPGHRVGPVRYSNNLGIISIESVMSDKDQAVIWRGPVKISAIRQFLSDVEWGEMDYLIVDAPPGTGDEPLTVAQTIPEARAVIVTTPQEVSLADVRKSINFCREVKLEILGIVENMSGQKCPQCGHEISLFKSGGGERTARDMGIPFLGKIPIDPAVVTAGDAGKPYVLNTDNGVAAKAFKELIDKIISMSK